MDIGGRSFYGHNAPDLAITMAPLNAQSRTHAEAHAFQQAKNAGIKDRTAVLYVDNKFCRSCGKYGGVGSMVRNLDLEKVLAITPEGSFQITAAQPSSPKPVALDSAEAKAILQAQTDAQARLRKTAGAQSAANAQATVKAAARAGPSWSDQARQVARSVVSAFNKNKAPTAGEVASPPKPTPASTASLEATATPAASAPVAATKPKPVASSTARPAESEAARAARIAGRVFPNAHDAVSRAGLETQVQASSGAKAAARAKAVASDAPVAKARHRH